MRKKIRKSKYKAVVIGGGVTGLSAGIASGAPVFEATDRAGGIGMSYYVRPGENKILRSAPQDHKAYRFEVGGGHWIFGSDPQVLFFLGKNGKLAHYSRNSAVFFTKKFFVFLIPYRIT